MVERLRNIVMSSVPPMSEVRKMVEVEINVAMKHLRAFNQQLQGEAPQERLEDIDAASIGLLFAFAVAIIMAFIVTTVLAVDLAKKYAAIEIPPDPNAVKAVAAAAASSAKKGSAKKKGRRGRSKSPAPRKSRRGKSPAPAKANGTAGTPAKAAAAAAAAEPTLEDVKGVFGFLLSVLLYAGAPFFAWPWKPMLNGIIGAKYARAYKHFRADHSDRRNLQGHFACLLLQLFANFALLYALDCMVFIALGWVSSRGFTHGYLKIMPYSSHIARHVGVYYDLVYTAASFFIRFGLLAGATFAYWVYYLATCPAFKPAKAGAVLLVFAAYYLRAHVMKNWHLVALGCLVPVTFALHTYVVNGVRFTSGKKKGGTLDKKTLGPVAFGVAAVAWLLVSTRGALCRFATHAAIRAGRCNPGKVWNPLQTAEATTAVNWAVIAFMVGTAIFNPIPEKARVHV